LTEVEWAWCAGLFEGEGCISFTGLNCVRLSVANCDYEVLDKLDALWPSTNGVKLHHEQRGNHSACYAWEIGERDRVRGFLTGILPWLCTRRRKRALAALKRLEGNLGQGGALNADKTRLAA
jgi:hypothetical protein